MINQAKIEKAIASIIQAVGEDPEREGLVETPRRIAQMYADFFSGLEQDPVEVLATGFDEAHQEMVVLKDIPFFSMCEHHLLPFYGSASIGYVPNGRLVGISKLARALDILARRPQIQERLTRQLAESIFSAIHPDGLAVILSADHMCMSMRGAKKPGAKVVTSVSRGSIRTQETVRREFYALLGED